MEEITEAVEVDEMVDEEQQISEEVSIFCTYGKPSLTETIPLAGTLKC